MLETESALVGKKQIRHATGLPEVIRAAQDRSPHMRFARRAGATGATPRGRRA